MTSNQTLADEFAAGKKHGTGSHLFIEGNTIYSYGYHFPIATIKNDNTVLFNEDKYSPTTSKHQTYVRRALIAAGFILKKSNTSSLQSLSERTYQESSGRQKRKIREMI